MELLNSLGKRFYINEGERILLIINIFFHNKSILHFTLSDSWWDRSEILSTNYNKKSYIVQQKNLVKCLLYL